MGEWGARFRAPDSLPLPPFHSLTPGPGRESHRRPLFPRCELVADSPLHKNHGAEPAGRGIANLSNNRDYNHLVNRVNAKRFPLLALNPYLPHTSSD